MKVSKGPQSTKQLQETDTQSLAKWAEDWRPSKQLLLDATIKKEGRRHTAVGIEFGVEDISALHDALQRHQRNRIQTLNEDTELLKVALRKICRIVSLHRKNVIGADVLLETVKKVAYHFLSNSTRRTPIDLGDIRFEDL